MQSEYVIAQADKTVLRISGLSVKGMNTHKLEQVLEGRLKSRVRVIGVTGDAVEMDIYGLAPEQIQEDEKGIIQALALADGITVTDLAKICDNRKIVDVGFDEIPAEPTSMCHRERWIKRA
jgi:hypothetical protein